MVSARSPHVEVRKEAFWALSNATCNAGNEQLTYLVEQQGIIPLFCECYTLDNDLRLIAVAMEGLDNLLRAKDDLQINLIDLVKECGEEHLVNLCSHKHPKIVEKARSLLQ